MQKKKCLLQFSNFLTWVLQIFVINSIFDFYFLNEHAEAQSFSLTNTRNARTFEAQHESLIIKSLGFACLGLEVVEDGLPCNPAMVGKNRKASLRASGLISNGYSNLSKVRQLTSGSLDQNLISDLFTSQKVLQVESSIDVMFRSQYLSSRVSPSTMKFFSVIRNDANPEAELFAVEEKNMLIMSSYSLNNFDFGLGLKKVDWKYLRKRFRLLDAATPGASDLLKPKSQSATFLIPSINVYLPNFWNFRVTLMGVNLGHVENPDDDFQHPEELQAGVGLTPPLSVGRLDFMLDYKSLSFEESDASERVHFGALYKYGVMTLASGFDHYGGSFGLYYGLELINAGVLFSSTKMPWNDQDYYSQTVYLQLGWQL